MFYSATDSDWDSQRFLCALSSAPQAGALRRASASGGSPASQSDLAQVAAAGPNHVFNDVMDRVPEHTTAALRSILAQKCLAD